MDDLSLFAVHVKMAGGQGISPVLPDFREEKIFTVVSPSVESFKTPVCQPATADHVSEA